MSAPPQNSRQSGEGVRDDATARAVFGWMLAAVALLAALVVVLLILHAEPTATGRCR